MDVNLQQEKAQKTFAHMMKASRLQSYHTITDLDNQDESLGTCYRCSKSNRRLNTLCFYCEHIVCQGCTQSCNRCNSVFCVACSIIDYSNTDERSFCLSCYTS
ncbi:hypothetical protein BJ944DRAFT_259720 [Cunninghamella echinulata]|nr:hypothetical protein BJ944DRAFT_259720 [Cunninghamella echinulata]